jgi:hypothetical protein
LNKKNIKKNEKALPQNIFLNKHKKKNSVNTRSKNNLTKNNFVLKNKYFFKNSLENEKKTIKENNNNDNINNNNNNNNENNYNKNNNINNNNNNNNNYYNKNNNINNKTNINNINNNNNSYNENDINNNNNNNQKNTNLEFDTHYFFINSTKLKFGEFYSGYKIYLNFFLNSIIENNINNPFKILNKVFFRKKLNIRNMKLTKICCFLFNKKTFFDAVFIKNAIDILNHNNDFSNNFNDNNNYNKDNNNNENNNNDSNNYYNINDNINKNNNNNNNNNSNSNNNNNNNIINEYDKNNFFLSKQTSTNKKIINNKNKYNNTNHIEKLSEKNEKENNKPQNLNNFITNKKFSFEEDFAIIKKKLKLFNLSSNNFENIDFFDIFYIMKNIEYLNFSNSNSKNIITPKELKIFEIFNKIGIYINNSNINNDSNIYNVKNKDQNEIDCINFNKTIKYINKTKIKSNTILFYIVLFCASLNFVLFLIYIIIIFQSFYSNVNNKNYNNNIQYNYFYLQNNTAIFLKINSSYNLNFVYLKGLKFSFFNNINNSIKKLNLNTTLTTTMQNISTFNSTRVLLNYEKNSNNNVSNNNYNNISYYDSIYI